MEKMINKLMIAGVACVALCGSALAAPKHQAPTAPRAPAPQHQVQKAHKDKHQAPKVVRHTDNRDHRHHEVRLPQPPPRHTDRHVHCNRSMHSEDWAELGVGILAGVLLGI